MIRQKELLVDYVEFENPEKVGLGDGKTVEAVGMGKVAISRAAASKGNSVNLSTRMSTSPIRVCNSGFNGARQC